MGAANPTRVVVGLSGGVDSAVAALRLVAAGHDVHGLFMSNWDDEDSYCTSAQDYQDARSTARELGIVLHRVSFALEYQQQVFGRFLAEYRLGRTPNPDVLCNREIKFGICQHYAQRLGAAWFATGHYARLVQGEYGPELLRGSDTAKDQSYFLCGVERARFAQVLFPLGDLTKSEVRAQARLAGLPVYNKPDSTGICFIGERPFTEFLARYLPESPGPIETIAGQVLGTHRGLPFYTLGQRGGLEIGGIRGGSGDPWYVARKDGARNALIVVAARDRSAATAQAARTAQINWLIEPPADSFSASVKLRYRQPDQAAHITCLADGSAQIRFESPQWAVTPGQTAAIYLRERCLGGGVIEESL
jgi:tRNA-uridine 2-sulfurtransferase